MAKKILPGAVRFELTPLAACGICTEPISTIAFEVGRGSADRSLLQDTVAPADHQEPVPPSDRDGAADAGRATASCPLPGAATRSQRQHRGQGLRRVERSGVLSIAPGQGQLRSGNDARGELADFREDRLRDLLGRAVVEALSLGYSLEQIEGALVLQWAQLA